MQKWDTALQESTAKMPQTILHTTGTTIQPVLYSCLSSCDCDCVFVCVCACVCARAVKKNKKPHNKYIKENVYNRGKKKGTYHYNLLKELTSLTVTAWQYENENCKSNLNKQRPQNIFKRTANNKYKLNQQV